MKKKLPLILGIVVFVIAIVIALVVVLSGNKEEGEIAQKTINLEEASNEIVQKSDFAEMASEEITPEILESYFQVNIENVENVVGKIPLMNVHSSMYVIVQAKEGKVNDVKSELDEFCTQYEQQWKIYIAQQYEYVKNRKTGTIGDYAYVIIAENAEELEQIIK